MGYKQNTEGFRKLAANLPLSDIRTIAGNDVFAVAALLLGTAGLLPSAPSEHWSMDARHLHRRLWDHWFKAQGLVEGVCLDRKSWNLSGVRPQNHPVRRLAAAANLVVRCPGVYAEIGKLLDKPALGGVKQLESVFDVDDQMNFWNWHLGFGTRRAKGPVSLVGADRRAALVTNVCIPWLLARGCRPEGIFDVLPEAAGNAGIRYAAQVLFGRDHNPAIYRNGLLQQGLLQFFEDCCER